MQITWERRPNGFGLDDRVAVLGDGNNRLEVWPALGFNVYRWQVGGAELLYRRPEFFDEKRPTRSGFPILFPFPNRIRDGRYTWAGKSYTLPLGDPALKNAIHGFVCGSPWRVIDQGADTESAWITGAFQGSIDAPETLALWPADYRMHLTYRLMDHILRVEMHVANDDVHPLPFGVGFHPYLSLAPFGGEQAVVAVNARQYWELADNLPTGKLLEVDAGRDLREGRRLADLHLDDLLTDLEPYITEAPDELGMLGFLQHPSHDPMVLLWATPHFRELVAFTPPHREAICLEPYTCMTDAINLSASGVPTGLRVVPPGDYWQGIVELRKAL